MRDGETKNKRPQLIDFADYTAGLHTPILAEKFIYLNLIRFEL